MSVTGKLDQPARVPDRFRRRIDRDDSEPELIVTVRGVGDMFD